MRAPLSWQYDEFQLVGKNYQLPSEVNIYDASHDNFRNIEQESQQILDTLGIGKGDRVIDFGAGTGTLAIMAAQRGASVYAVDVSATMIDYAKAKASRVGITNITFAHSGFLNYEALAGSFDAIITVFALHHLPDFWKGVALDRIHQLLKPQGQLYIHDVVLGSHQAVENITTFIAEQAAAGGDFLQKDAEEHFKYEYSTYDWIMEGLLKQAGLTIIHQHLSAGVIGRYLCRKST